MYRDITVVLNRWIETQADAITPVFRRPFQLGTERSYHAHTRRHTPRSPMTEEPDHTMRMVPDPTQGGRLVWKWRAEPNEQAADRCVETSATNPLVDSLEHVAPVMK